MEYYGGVLIVSYAHPHYGTTIEFIKWEDIRGMTFNDTIRPDPRDFSVLTSPEDWKLNP